MSNLRDFDIQENQNKKREEIQISETKTDILSKLRDFDRIDQENVKREDKLARLKSDQLLRNFDLSIIDEILTP